jgi:hypothetical protein
MTPGTNQPAERGEKARQSEQCAWLTSVKTPHGMHYTLLRVAMLATCNGDVTSIPNPYSFVFTVSVTEEDIRAQGMATFAVMRSISAAFGSPESRACSIWSSATPLLAACLRSSPTDFCASST